MTITHWLLEYKFMQHSCQGKLGLAVIEAIVDTYSMQSLEGNRMQKLMYRLLEYGWVSAMVQ